MEKVFSDLINTSKPADLTTFCMDDRHRKFYLGNNIGNIKSFNAINGVFIKTIDEEEENTTEHRKRAYEANYTKEITSLIYVNEDHLLITASFNSIINVYDENNPEVAIKLRSIKGGHGYSEIRCLEYSAHLALMASGDLNGVIDIWDFETSRLEGLCLFHTREILALKFLDPFPILVSSSADGYICLWAIRKANPSQCYSCLCRLPNLQISEREMQYSSIVCMEPFVIKARKFVNEKPTILTGKELKYYYNKFVKENDLDSQALLSSPQQRNSNMFTFIEAEDLVDKNPLEVKLRAFMTTGDEKGRIRIWDFTSILSHYSINPVESYRHQRACYNPKRSEQVNAAIQLKLIKQKYVY